MEVDTAGKRVVFSGDLGAPYTGGRWTTWRAIAARRVRLDGGWVQVRAQVHTLPGYSAHGDRDNLVRFVRGIRRGPERVVLVHGEAGARRALGEVLNSPGPAPQV